LSVVNIASVIRASYPAIYKVLKNELVFQTDYLNKKEQINRVVLNQKSLLILVLTFKDLLLILR